MNNRRDFVEQTEREYLGIPFRSESLIDALQSYNEIQITEDVLDDPNSKYRAIINIATSPSEDIATGDGQSYIVVPFDANLVAVHGKLVTASSSGSVRASLTNENGVDILAGFLELGANYTDSFDYPYQPYVKKTRRSFKRRDLISVNIDAAGTGAQGLIVTLYFLADNFYGG